MDKLHTLMFSFFYFFLFSGNKNQLCPTGNKRYVGLFFSAKHNASNIKAAVVTRLDYSYYSWRKPIIILIIIIYYYYYFGFEGRY